MEHLQQLRGYIDQSGKFERLPGKKQKKNLDAMLTCLISHFEVGEMYSEIDVNNILNEQHSFKDPATLRRLLFGTERLDRTTDGKRYWVKEN